MTMNDILLKAIRERQEKQTEFNFGILTADRYVQTLLDSVGSDVCYNAAAKGLVSFADIVEKASQTLVYANEDMEVSEKARDRFTSTLPDGVELPKNTLMVFKHTLTTPRKDRDGDILRTEGMEVDPKMLLLWQHVHTMPIGKMLLIATQNSKTLDLWSCIIDLNETSHDAAVMVDNGMGRFSHGFKAKEFDKVKGDKGATGFDIKRAEIMEESLVSVPANVDSETQEIVLSLVEGGKLTSPIMKEFGRCLLEKQDPVVPVKLELEEKHEDESSDESDETGTSEEASVGSEKDEEGVDDKASADEEVKDDEEEKEAPTCPKCGSQNLKDGQCQKCNYKVPDKEKPSKEEDEEKKETELDGEKKGRVLSGANEKVLRECKEYADRAYELGPPLECKACIRHTSRGIGKVLKSLGEVPGKDVEEIETKDSMSDWIAHATKAERDRLIKVLEGLNKRDETDRRMRKFRQVFGK